MSHLIQKNLKFVNFAVRCYIEFLFCKQCRIEENNRRFGLLASKNEYCLQCYIRFSSTTEKLQNASENTEEIN